MDQIKRINLSNNYLGIYSPLCHSKVDDLLEFTEPAVTLEELDLSHNTILQFNVDVRKLSNLASLDLSHNGLKCLDSEATRTLQFMHNARIKQGKKTSMHIYLNNNDFKCNCECLDFYKWLNKTLIFCASGLR